jgi:hypothetical protein
MSCKSKSSYFSNMLYRSKNRRNKKNVLGHQAPVVVVKPDGSRVKMSAVTYRLSKLKPEVSDELTDVERLKSLPYIEYLKTPHWLLLKKRKLKQRRCRCETCGAQRCELHVHHLTYENLGHEPLSDLKVLCLHCHDKVHGRKEKIEKMAWYNTDENKVAQTLDIDESSNYTGERYSWTRTITRVQTTNVRYRRDVTIL